MHLSKNIITVILPEIMEILYEYEANYGHYLKSVFFLLPILLRGCLHVELRSSTNRQHDSQSRPNAIWSFLVKLT